MARPLRIEHPGAVYHITSRGNAREDIFLRTHQRVGHVFQGRYKAILVEKDSHLLELCRYVVLNPVRAGMVAKPDHWKWSSYNKSTVYSTTVPVYLTIDWVLGQFAEKTVTARQRYRKFVADGLVDQERPWKKLVGQVFLGSESFVARMEELLGDKREIREIPRAQRYPGRPTLNRLFADIPVAGRQQRNQRMVESHITYGYTLKEIADFLGVHYTTYHGQQIGGQYKEKVIFQDLTPKLCSVILFQQALVQDFAPRGTDTPSKIL